MNNILIKTTFKNSTILLKPFYNFYKDIWNPKKFVFIIGYSTNIFNEIDLIKNIENILNTKFNKLSLNNKLNNAYDIKLLDDNENISILLYRTEEFYDVSVWDNLRYKLYNLIHTFSQYNTFEYYLNTDNDDFFYLDNVKNYLASYQEINDDYFHALEFISHDKFDLTSDFNFISGAYYYRLNYANLLRNRSNSHIWCRKLNLKSKYKNEWHSGINCACKNFDIMIDKSENINYNMICFCFGCLDLEFLLKDKHFMNTEKNTEKYKYNKSKILYSFNKNYKLTKEEKKNNIILQCNFLKKYFI